MLKLALSDIERVTLSRMELEQKEISFTWQTIQRLQKSDPDARFTLILGDDQYRALLTWTNFLEWAESVDYLVFQRPESLKLPPPLLPPSLKIDFHDRIPPSISASEIRKSFETDQKLPRDSLDPKVKAYILDHHLYCT
jgi:nicotinate-nucleotide adenylyltransferase